MIRLIVVLWLLIVAFIVGGGPLSAQETPPESAEARTTSDPGIEIKKLSLTLMPLTAEELAVEAEGWMTLAKERVQAVSELALQGGSSGSAEMVALQDSKTAVLERFREVLDEWERKGGDADSYRTYAKAVSGVQVDVTDAGATWSAFSGWLRSKEGGIKWGLRLLQFLVILAVFWGIARFVRGAVRRAAAANDTFSELFEQFLIKMSFRAVMLLGLIVALGTLDVNVGGLLALIGGASFIVGFALQDTLGNFAAGVMLLIYRPFDVGDSVEVGGVSGKIDNVSLVSTTIRTFDNKIVLVPNKTVWGEVITNASASATRRVDLVFGISYEDDVEKAQAILEKIVDEDERVLKSPAPTVRLHELADSSVNFICRPWTKTADYWGVYWDTTGRVKAEFEKAGISIPFPQQELHLRRA